MSSLLPSSSLTPSLPPSPPPCRPCPHVAGCVQVARGEGLLGFYRGFTAVAVGSVPANMAYFGGYEAGKVLVPGGPAAAAHFVCV